MKFNKYYFENYSSDVPFNIDNPRYVLSLDGVDEVIETIIQNEPYSLNINDFNHKKLVNALLHIDVIKQNNGQIAMNVPFFIEEDANTLMKLSREVAS